MNKKQYRTLSATKQDSFLATVHPGFNYFHQINFSANKKIQEKPQKISRTVRTIPSISQKQDHNILKTNLKNNKKQFTRIHTQLQTLRQNQISDYLKKSIRYQEILNINDNKKKRITTLNKKIGEVVKKSAIQAIAKQTQFTMTSIVFKCQSWKPQSRQGHTTIIYKNMAIIIGGHCSYPFNQANVYSFQSFSWIKQMNLLTARSYHTSLLYKSRFVIIFGGMGNYDVSRRCRICYNSVNLFDLQGWSVRNIKMNNEDSIQGRRSHAGIIIGKYMLILGGVNTKKQYLSDFAYLDLKQLRWYHKQYKVDDLQLQRCFDSGIAKHKIISTFKSHHKNYPIYSSEYSDTEGLLIIGGFFGNNVENIISFMGFNKYNPYIKKINYSGMPPSSIQPIVQRLNQNILVILSGQSYDRGIKLYKIKQKQFVGVYKFINPSFFGGVGSTINKYSDEMFIFFGLGEGGYIGTVNSIRLQQSIVQKGIRKKKESYIQNDWKREQDKSQIDSSNEQTI